MTEKMLSSILGQLQHEAGAESTVQVCQHRGAEEPMPSTLFGLNDKQIKKK